MDVVAKHRARVSVSAADGRPGKSHESGLRQGVTQVLRITGLVFGVVFRRCKVNGAGDAGAIARGVGHRRAGAVFDLARFQLGFKAILRAVRLIGNHHNIAPLA